VTRRPADVYLAYRGAPAWTDPETADRMSRHTFRTTAAATRSDLIDEARHLAKGEAIDVIVELVAPDSAFYKDGTGLRSDRSHHVAHVGVVLRLVGTKHGDLRYACDAFNSWEANLRAIVLGLHDLRRVERYGIGKRGEQYVGWAALNAGTAMGAAQVEEAMTVEYAAAVLAGGTDGTFSPLDVLGDPDDARAAYRTTAKRYHPDRGGDPAVMAKVNKAWALLSDHHGIGS
jgi:hypothetical protein